jgi:hypothetical protein
VRRRFRQGVSIRPVQTAQAETLLAHPDEALEVRQSLVPLGVAIDHYGHFDVRDFRRFDLRLAAPDNTQLASDNLNDFFAPAEFFELSQDQRLTRKSFDSYNAGVSVTGLDNLQGGRFRLQKVDYERKFLGEQTNPPISQLARLVVQLPPVRFLAQVRSNAIGRSRTGRRVNHTVRDDFSLQQEEFVIVNSEDLTPFEPAQPVTGSEAAVHTALNHLVQQDPTRRERLTVVSRWELNHE